MEENWNGLILESMNYWAFLKRLYVLFSLHLLRHRDTKDGIARHRHLLGDEALGHDAYPLNFLDLVPWNGSRPGFIGKSGGAIHGGGDR